MKHIFTIHSPITFLVSYAVIVHFKLKRQDVILLTRSNYKPPVEGFIVKKDLAELENSFISKLRNMNFPHAYDKYIKSICEGDNYTAYVDLMSYYQKILVTNSACKAFHFIEEGNSTYQTTDDLTDLTWSERSDNYRFSGAFSASRLKAIVRVLRGYSLRLLSIPYHYQAYANFINLNYYCLSDNAFYNAPQAKKVILNIDSDSSDIKKMSASESLNNELIWIDGSAASFTNLPQNVYYEAIDKAVKKLIIDGKLPQHVYVKLRPGIKDSDDNYLVLCLKKNNRNVTLLPDQTVLEALFIVSSNCTVVGNLSTALEYAHVFGHKAYSIYSLFEKQPPTFFDRMDGFWKNVEKL